MGNKFIIHVSINFEGGVGTVIKNLIIYQLNKGYRVGILYREDLSEQLSIFSEIINKIELISCKGSNIRGMNTLKGIPMKRIYHRLVKEYPEEDIIFHAHNPVTIGILNKIKNIPMICTLHGVNHSRIRLSQYLTKKILNKIFNYNKIIVPVSKDTANYYFQNRINDPRIQVVNNGLNIKPKLSRIHKDYFNIGYVSYIDDLKGWEVLFKAFVILFKEYGDKIRLIIAGEGPLDQIEKLKKSIKKYKLEGIVLYYGYVENAGDVIFPLLDVFVLPSKSEGMPMSILEAMGNSVPVLATEVGGIPEVIVDRENGMFIKRDAVDIYEKLKTLIEDKNIYDIISRNVYSSYMNNFTMETMGKKYDTIYFQVQNHKFEDDEI